MNSLKNIAINLAIPLVIALCFFVLTINQQKIPNFLFDLVPYLFYAISLIIVLVSWHFNRNRFIFVIAPLLLIYLGFEYLSAKKATQLFMYASILYPLNLIIFLTLKERGLFSIWGFLKILFLALQIALVFYLLEHPQTLLLEYLDTKIFTFNTYPLKHIAVGVALFSSFIITSLILFNRYVVYNSSFFIILLCFYAGLYFLKYPFALDMAFLAIGVVIFTLLIRESYRLAFYDELTELPGRRALIEDMAKLGRKYTLAMVDIDFFKKFNDTYGHDTGDEVLKMVAKKLAEVSGGGTSYRYGGEEFTILFPSKDVDESFIHTDTLRANIAATPFMVRGKKTTKKIFINISAGVVQNSSKDKDPFAVMKRADKALYKAKKSGRNKVVKA